MPGDQLLRHILGPPAFHGRFAKGLPSRILNLAANFFCGIGKRLSKEARL